LLVESVDINQPFDSKEVGGQIAKLVEQRAVVPAHVGQRSQELGDSARHNFDSARDWVATAR
jgi:hypothetical protein